MQGRRKEKKEFICKTCGKHYWAFASYRWYCDECLMNMEKMRNRRRRKVEGFYKRHYEQKKRYTKQYAKEHPEFRINENIRKVIWRVLKNKKAGRGWESLVGYTLSDLIKHLENQFNNKMSWKNYGTYWEVDHIKPKNLFNYSCPEDKEFKECWALGNLQPLPAMGNRYKGCKYFSL